MTMHVAYSPGGHRCGTVAFRLASAMPAAGCAVAIGACGTSGGGQATVGATTASGNASPLGLSQCMRAHGISNFPDPGNGPGGQGPAKPIGSPALRHAVDVCGGPPGLRKR